MSTDGNFSSLGWITLQKSKKVANSASESHQIHKLRIHHHSSHDTLKLLQLCYSDCRKARNPVGLVGCAHDLTCQKCLHCIAYVKKQCKGFDIFAARGRNKTACILVHQVQDSEKCTLSAERRLLTRQSAVSVLLISRIK